MDVNTDSNYIFYRQVQRDIISDAEFPFLSFEEWAKFYREECDPAELLSLEKFMGVYN